MLDARPIFFVIGVMLNVLAALMLIPASVDFFLGHAAWVAFAQSAAITAFFGTGMMLASRSQMRDINLRQAFLLTSLSWAVVAAFGALPFPLTGIGLSYTDGYFETMSGLTTTGSTVIAKLELASSGLLLWRSLLHWIGGIGIIALAVAILPLLRIGGMQIFRLESSDKSDKVLPRAAQIAGGIGMIYVALSALCALVYWLGGMSGFDAINHAMATLATGGFSTYDESFGRFDNAFLDAAGTLFMLSGGMTFTLYLRAQHGDPGSLLRDSQTRWYLAIWAGFSIVIALWLIIGEGRGVGYALRHATFTVASILTTTGFVSTDYGQWGPFPLVLVFLLTFVGSCSGSTAGGIKVFRFQVMFEIGRAQMHHALLPSGVFVPKYNGKPINDAVAQSVLAFVVLYAMTWAISASALALCGLDITTALSGAATALGNVGPGLGEIIGPAGNFAPLPATAKWILSLTMLLGRLELITVLVLLSRRFWRD
jgi:trk system potassium uptake protein TrkH